jgi:hypothetical protein
MGQWPIDANYALHSLTAARNAFAAGNNDTARLRQMKQNARCVAE